MVSTAKQSETVETPAPRDALEIEIIAREEVRPVERRWPPDDPSHHEVRRRVGKQSQASLRVVMEEQAWDAAYHHADENRHKEIGGLLLGEYCVDQGQHYVLIQQALPAGLNESHTAALVFTIEALLALDERHEREFPKLRVMGWYHTHPGMGIFFSWIDSASHESQYTEPFHVGMVIDPVKQDAGFFVWEDSRLVGPVGFWLVAPRQDLKDEKTAPAPQGTNTLVEPPTAGSTFPTPAQTGRGRKEEDHHG